MVRQDSSSEASRNRTFSLLLPLLVSMPAVLAAGAGDGRYHSRCRRRRRRGVVAIRRCEDT